MTITDTSSTHGFRGTLRGTWELDPARSRVEFRVPHLWGLGTVRGQFDRYRGRLDLSAEPAIELTVDAASVQTGNARRDRHLRTADFLDAENHPQIRFVSESAVLSGETLKLRGRLHARGQSIPLELDAAVRRVDGEIVVEASAIAPHRELGMTWSPLGMIGRRSELRVQGYLVPTG